MIGSLRGVVAGRSAGEVLLEVAGVGYRLSVPSGTWARAEPSAPLFVYVHTHVREDAIILYGFATLSERDTFEALLGVHGVGPALALALLSTHDPTTLRHIVMADDVDALTVVPGVGRKTASRLLLELKAKLDHLHDADDPGSTLGPPSDTGGAPGSARSEVRAALAALGYSPDEIRSALREIPDAEEPGALLKAALRQLAGAR